MFGRVRFANPDRNDGSRATQTETHLIGGLQWIGPGWPKCVSLHQPVATRVAKSRKSNGAFVTLHASGVAFSHSLLTDSGGSHGLDGIQTTLQDLLSRTDRNGRETATFSPLMGGNLFNLMHLRMMRKEDFILPPVHRRARLSIQFTTCQLIGFVSTFHAVCKHHIQT